MNNFTSRPLLLLALLALPGCPSATTSPGIDASRVDTGVGSTDTGVLPPDTGVAPPDTGVVPRDTGVAAVDTGVAPQDTGIVPRDTGSPAFCASAAFPTDWDRGCTTSDSCSTGLHTRDCCGGHVVIPFNHSETARFAAAEAIVMAMCPATCDCVASDILEDGTPVSPGAVVALCEGGTCIARALTR